MGLRSAAESKAMAKKAVFLDRDNTIIDDPGYLADRGAVKLLPGADLAIRSLAKAGYKIIVVTNQSGVAKGLITEEALKAIHAEMCHQLSSRGAHLDAIYYCPYHPEGTVEPYAADSDLRKPSPGMLLKGARELDIDLRQSWMVGDSSRDVEAGQRAGCRTVRVRTHATRMTGEAIIDDVQPDFTARNLADAARVILREGDRDLSQPARKAAEQPSPPPSPSEEEAPRPAGSTDNIGLMDDTQVRREILRYVRQLARTEAADEFSFTKVIAGIFQALAILALAATVVAALGKQPLAETQVWATVTAALQLMALTFFTMHRMR